MWGRVALVCGLRSSRRLAPPIPARAPKREILSVALQGAICPPAPLPYAVAKGSLTSLRALGSTNFRASPEEGNSICCLAGCHLAACAAPRRPGGDATLSLSVA